MDYEERSPLWGIGVTTAAASGIGSAIYSSRNELLSALRVANKDVAAETANIVSQMARYNLQPLAATMGVMDEHQAGILSLTGNQRLIQQDIAQSAYESILSGKRVSHSKAYNAFQHILKQPNVLAAYSTASNQIQQHSGNLGILSARMQEIAYGGIYSESRKADLVSNVVASHGKFSMSRSMAERDDISKSAMSKATEIKRRLGDVSGSTKIKWNGIYNVADSFGDKEIVTPVLKGMIAGKGINIPLENTGLAYGGENLTARYVTRGAYDTSGKGFDYIERYTSMLEEVLQSKKSQSITNRSVASVHNDLIGMLNDRDSASRAQAVWNMPESVMPSGAKARARMIAMQAVSSAGEEFSESAVGNLMSKGLFPIGSPDVVAKGTYYTKDISEGLYGPLGKWFPIEKRPDQFIRSEWGVTSEAKSLAGGFKGTFGEGYSRLNRKITGDLYDKIVTETGYVAPQLTTFYAKSGGLGFASDPLNEIMFAEQALVSSDVSDMMEYERVVQHKVSLDEGFRVNKDIAGALEGAEMGQVKRFKTPIGGGKFLGINQSTGKEIWSNAVGSGRTDVIAAEMTGKNTATIYARERHKLGKGDYWKFFSEENKFMGTSADKGEMSEVLRAVGASDITKGVAGQNLEAIYSSKLLEKNTFARIQQQTEAMAMFAGEQIDNNILTMRQRIAAKEMIADPIASLGIKELLASGTVDAEYKLEKNMVSLAKGWGFSQRQMQMTFGLMEEESIQKMTEEGVLRKAEGNVISKSTGVVGLSKMRLGNLATDAVGGLASMEQSGFRLLAMKGEEGQRMAAELATRLRDKGELAPAEKMLASVVNETDKIKRFIGGTSDRTLSQLKPDELIETKGRYVELGTKVKSLGGSNQIYIPGTEEAPGLTLGTISPKGKPIESPINAQLKNLQKAIISKDTDLIETAGTALRGIVHQAYEAQGAARGKIIGSRFLTGIRQRVADSADDTFRISEQSGKLMFNELLEHSSSEPQKKFLESQKSKLLAGEAITGGVWRHPTTGPESFQFVNYKVDKRIKGNLISAPARFGSISLDGGIPKQMDFSQMVGMKGDFDKDIYALSVISDEGTSAKVRRKLSTSAQEDYTKYLFNHYALEETIGESKGAAKKISEINRVEAISSGARKLTEAKIATPKVNIALQKLKIGLQYSAPDKYKPLAELFWHLEEAAIGGKHGVMEGSLYKNIAHAVERKDVKTMESVLTGLLGEKRTIQGQLSIGDKILQQSMTLDPTGWAKTAIESAENVSDEVDIAYRSAQIAKGKKPLREVNQVVEMMYQRKSGSLDVAQSLMYAGEKGIGQSISEGANRMMRKGKTKVSAISRVLGKAKGPAAIGLAAAAGIAMMAPSVSGSLKTEGSRGGKNFVPSDLGPTGGPGINPPQPRIMSSPKVYDMGGMRSSSRANIRMSLGDANSSSESLMSRVRDMANNGSVNLRTIDDRSVLDAHSLASKIHERL